MTYFYSFYTNIDQHSCQTDIGFAFAKLKQLHIFRENFLISSDIMYSEGL